MNTKVKVKLMDALEPDKFIPVKEHAQDAAWDLRSTIQKIILPGETFLFPTGIAIQLEKGYEAQIRSRSGNALKKGLQVANSPGTIDEGYTGEIGVILYNSGAKSVEIFRGDKIAQMVIQKLPEVELEVVEELDQSERGSSGFGSTGLAGKQV